MTMPARTYTDYIGQLAGVTPMDSQAETPTSSYGVGGDQGIQASQSPTASTVTQETAPDQTATSQGSTAQTSTESYTPPTKSGEAYNINLGNYWGNPENTGIYQSLFSPVQQDVSGTGKGLQEATKGFLDTAGTRRTWEGIGGPSILEDVISGTKPTQTAVDLGKAEYKGTGLAQDSLDRLSPGIGDVETWQGAFKQPGVTEELVGQRTPGLTAGELGFESRKLHGEEGYLRAQETAQQEISKLLADYTRAQTEAQGIAAQKTADEADIAKQTTGYLTGRGGGISDAWSKAVSEAQAANQAAQTGWDKFQGSGSIQDLQAVPATSNVDLSKFNTPERQLYSEGKTAYDAILNDPKFASIKDVPLMQLGTSNRGHELMQFPADWWTAHQGDHSSAEWKTIKQLARDRQKAIDTGGFTGGRFGSNQYYPDPYLGEGQSEGPGRYTSVIGDPTIGAKAGKYSEVVTPYFAGNFTPEDLRNYTRMETTDPNRENISTGDQRAQYNKIQDILAQIGSISEADMVQDPGVAFEKARILSDIDNYLAKEEAAFTAHKGELSTQQKEWQQLVKSTRDQVKEGDRNFVSKIWHNIF